MTLNRKQWFQVCGRPEVRAAVAAAVEAAVRAEIHTQLQQVPMDAAESLTAEGLLYDMMYPEAMRAAMQHLYDAGMATGEPIQVRVVRRGSYGLRAAEWVAGVKASDAKAAGLFGERV